MEEIISTDKDKTMDDFQSQISEAQSAIKYIELQNDQLIQLKSQVEKATGKEQESEVSSNINKIISNVQAKQSSMKGIIDSLEQMMKEKQNEDNPETRIKQNLFGSMTKKYQNVCIKFQNLESDIKNIMQTKNIRAAEIVLGKELSDNEKAEVINDPKYVEQIYGDKLKGGAHVTLQNAVADLEERHKDIKNLEKSILQVHNLIIDLSKLVQLQGEMIDNIDANIQKAVNYVHKGEKNLIKAKENMKKARKKKCIILIIAIVILLIVLVPILIRFV
jgi:t-SNARE complex subunit (syntaxin)